jgi:hypothetical protein
LLLGVAFSVAILSSTLNGRTTEQTIKRASGSATAAGDLYGLGVRVGLYLQTVGILLSLISVELDEKTDKKGVGQKLAISANILAILFSMATLVHRQTISPCEVWLTLTLVQQLVYASWAALCNPYTLSGEGLGLLAFCLANMSFSVVNLVFWATWYKELPWLGTPNLAWFYTSVRIDHWFRIASIVSASFNLVVSLIISVLVLAFLSKVPWVAWWDGEDSDLDEMNWMKGLRLSIAIFASFPAWVMTIAGAEEIIKLNGLTPQTDFTQPGQSIPFAIGIVVAVDGLAAVLKPGRGS